MSEEVKAEVQAKIPAQAETPPPVMLPKGNELVLSSSPHIHAAENVPSIMFKVIIALLPAVFAGILLFGAAALLVIAYCIVFSVAAELLWCKLAGKPLSTVRDLSAVVTGLLLALNLSAGVPWWLCLIGAFIAIWLGKQVFGGLGHNPFNPALVARVALLIALPKYMTAWVPAKFMNGNAASYARQFFTPAAWNSVLGAPLDGVTCATPLGLVGTTAKVLGPAPGVFAEVANPTAYLQYFLGNVGGCLGETSALALLIGGLLLVLFKLIKWQIPVFYLGTVAVFTAVINYCFPGVTPPALFHLLTGGLMLGAIFMATDMVTSPMTEPGAIIFGIGCGIVTCVIRIWGNYPEGVSFAILFMNALVPLIDRFATKKPFGYHPWDRKKGAQA
ncbi:MAG: RnfABCDGE type electron transport complex subunit D [Victivallaceae bacterium]|nr:RnfABCDGE type electron transport complex subunit D [Victivallaceae bacterium]